MQPRGVLKRELHVCPISTRQVPSRFPES
jgi:hypothetical protein